MSMISEQIEELRLMAEMFVNGEPYGNLLRRAADTIEMLSEKARVSADRPRGEWVPFEYGDERWHKCTACGIADRYIEYVERPNGTTGKVVAVRNFCPNCGAKMKGADDERGGRC